MCSFFITTDDFPKGYEVSSIFAFHLFFLPVVFTPYRNHPIGIFIVNDEHISNFSIVNFEQVNAG